MTLGATKCGENDAFRCFLCLQEASPANELMSTLKEANPVDTKMNASQLSLFHNSTKIANECYDDESEDKER